MKNFYVITTCLSLLLTCLILPGAQSQSLVVGTVKNGQPILSSVANATIALQGGLTSGATISDIYIDLEPSSGKYFLIGTVSNTSITGKAIELVLEEDVLRAVPGGPGLEVTCTGTNCSECVPVIRKWKVRCECKDNPLPPTFQCDMTSKIIITPW